MNNFYDEYGDEDEAIAAYQYSNYRFAEHCEAGDLNGALLLIETNPNIDISWENNIALRYACSEGYLNVVKWLVHAIPFVDIWCGDEVLSRIKSKHYDIRSPFVDACINGNLCVAKYLLAYSEKKGITPDMRVISVCFDFACKRWVRGEAIAVWLQTLNPEKYFIYWNEDGTFNGYKIRTSKEINRERRWKQRKYMVWLASKQCPEQLQKICCIVYLTMYRDI